MGPVTKSEEYEENYWVVDSVESSRHSGGRATLRNVLLLKPNPVKAQREDEAYVDAVLSDRGVVYLEIDDQPRLTLEFAAKDTPPAGTVLGITLRTLSIKEQP